MELLAHLILHSQYCRR